MKPKIAPTSPKTEQEHREFEQFYAGQLQTIERPRHWPTGLVVALALLIGIGASIGSAAGLRWATLRYGPTSWVRWFISPQPTAVTVTAVNRSTDQVTPMTTRLEQLTPTVAAVYDGLPAQRAGVNDLPTRARFRGDAVVVASSGILVTTRDVLPSAGSKYSVLLDDRRVLAITEVVLDPASPFVFARVNDDHVRPAKFAAKESVALGGAVLAVTRGGVPDNIAIRSASITGLDIRSGDQADTLVESSDVLDRLMTHTAADVPAGTPLFNDRDELVGLTLVHPLDSAPAAVPSWFMTSALRRLLKGNDVVRPSLGVRYLSLDRTPLLEGFTADTGHGAYLTSADPALPAVAAKSSAAQAKLKAGDVILQVGDRTIDSVNPLSELIQTYDPGEIITLRTRRGSIEQSVKVTLGVLQSP